MLQKNLAQKSETTFLSVGEERAGPLGPWFE